MINVEFVMKHIKILDTEDTENILSEARKTNHCVWQIGDDLTCSGEIHLRTMFNDHLRIVACDKHLSEHIVIMTLRASGLDIETGVLNVDDKNAKFKEVFKTDTIDRELCEDILINTKKHDEVVTKSLSDEDLATTFLESLGV